MFKDIYGAASSSVQTSTLLITNLPPINNPRIRTQGVNAPMLVPHLLKHLCLAIIIGNIAFVEGARITEFLGKLLVGFDVGDGDVPAFLNETGGDGHAHS